MPLNLPNTPIHMPLETQEILAQISNNQNQIDLLTKNNTILVQYLLQKGVDASHLEYMYRRPDLRERLLSQQTNGHEPEPESPHYQQRALPAPKRRGRPPLAAAPSHGKHQLRPDHEYVIRPGSKIGWVIEFAREHDNVIDLGAFREDFRRRRRKPDSFAKTTVCGVCNRLAARGILRKLSGSTYQLVDDTHGPPVAERAALPAAKLPAAKPGAPSPPVPPRKPAKKAAATSKRPAITHRDTVLNFARSHDGVFSVKDFREAAKDMPTVPKTYPLTTVYTDLRTLELEDVVEKIGPGEYKLSPQ